MMELNTSQRKAVEFDGQNLLVLAGAGTGKTHTIIARALFLLEKGVPPHRIVLMTFTRRAAVEMAERLSSISDGASKKVHAGTFHNFCLRMMRSYPKLFGFDRFTVIDSDDQLQLMKIAVESVSDKDRSIGLPKPQKILEYFSYVRNTYINIEDYFKKYLPSLTPEEIQGIINCIKFYIDSKREKSYVDFDDLLFMFLNALKKNEALREKIKVKFDHILVDETQDTNPLQWEILVLMENPAKLFCVGDDAQSIYAFRGADFKNVREFKNRVENSEVIKFEENYRSYQSILDLSNFVLAESDLNYNKQLTGVRGIGDKPEIRDFYSKFEEAAWIAEDIKSNLIKYGKWSSMMILARTAFSAKAIEIVMLEKKIPYKFYGGSSIIKSIHIKNILSLCKASLFTDDLLSWVRYLSLWPKIGPKTASKIANEIAACNTIGEAILKIKSNFANKAEILEVPLEIDRKRENVTQALRIAWEAVKKNLNEDEAVLSRRENDVKLFIQLSQNYSSLEEILDIFTLEPVHASQLDKSEEDDCVRLMTIHSAKGTEAETCYIIQSQIGMFPHTRSIGDYDSEEEERRILYVAMTRAKERLVLTRSADNLNSYFWGGSTMKSPSTPENSYFLERVAPYVVFPSSNMINSYKNNSQSDQFSPYDNDDLI